jgi:hypothetical protein
MSRIALSLLLLLSTALPALAQDREAVAPKGAVACVSAERLWAFLDARESDEEEAQRQLDEGACRTLSGASYSLVEARNGVSKILVFRSSGAWESARTLYTLDEMLAPAPRVSGGAS